MASFNAFANDFVPASRIPELLNGLYTCETSDECISIAADLGGTIKTLGLHTLESEGVLNNLRTEAVNKKSGLAREGALLGIAGITRVLGRPGFPYLLPLLPTVLDGYADKGQPVREAAESAALAIIALPSPHATKLILPILYDAMERKWQTKVGALQLLGKLAANAPAQIGIMLPEIIPRVSDCLHETKSEVAQAATKCMMAVAGVAGNPDIAPHLPILVSCMARPTEVPQCIQKLSATTFVAEVTGPALAIMVPLLVRALNERSAAVLRPTVIIIDNLCKLVRDPAEAGQFLPNLLPGLDRIIETAAFPEVRALASAAKSTLLKAGGGGDVKQEDNSLPKPPTVEEVNNVLRKALADVAGVKDIDSFSSASVEHISILARELVAGAEFGKEEWKTTCSPYLTAFVSEEVAQKTVQAVLDHFYAIEKARRKALYNDDDDPAEELCNCDFSLAYGGMMLLNHTNLRLKRGRRYGLCGANGAGKSTLMRAISKGKVENFPPPEELRSVYVEHALQGEDTSLTVVDFVASDKNLSTVPRTDIITALETVGFTGDRLSQQVGTLSGGWKMKLELARAMLYNADILLLDEPTNHLDVTNVAWLEQFLVGQKNMTSLIVSHDSGFLDTVCTDIIHYERKKLVYYKGNLSEFVKKVPAAKTYYTLSDSAVKFSFPPPGFLQGINSKTKAILKVSNATYTYPGAAKPSLYDASGTFSLSTRLAILGANGAGKSTFIKILTGETVPQSGTVWKHPNLRIGYVAQHAFHHLNQHLEKTPNQYLQWRYLNGEDREILEKESRKMTAEDQAQMDKYLDVVNKKGVMEKRRVEYLIGRQKLKKSFQYEIKWVGLEHRHNTYMSREELLEHGFQKLVQAFDDREASREGQSYRELSPPLIRKHFEEVGLDGDVADHNPISGLSGGQKVKVVIAAAMWNNPHMLVLDEPTNFLDRDSLGGLAVAIRDWGGAVVMISHNEEFVGALCPEIWRVEGGKIIEKKRTDVEGGAFEGAGGDAGSEGSNSRPGTPVIVQEMTAEEEEKQRAKIEAKVKAKAGKKKLTRNEIKAREIRRRARHLKWLQEGGEKEPDTDED
ncbi:hypothetical protein HDV00_006074 [Rhizophlyctis rosea]|nr:hypothetical protein HDV00_006074 [Rhizophlyctis rosea]